MIGYLYGFIRPSYNIPYYILANKPNYVLRNIKTNKILVKATKRINQPKKIKKGKRNDF